MPALRKEVAPEIVAEARRLYENTLTPTQDIAAMMGICRSTLQNRVNEWKWNKRSTNRTATDFVRLVRGTVVAELTSPAEMGNSADVAADRQAALAKRILDVVERELDAVEAVLEKFGPADKAEAERSARTLASLSRTLHEIAALAKPGKATPPDDPDDDPIPLDADELRRELARRIRGLIAEEEREEEGQGADAPAGEVA